MFPTFRTLLEMGHTNARKLSYEDLACYTDNFSESNYLIHFQFGKLYRGKIVWPRRTQYVIVKIWEEPEIYNYMPGDNEGRLMVRSHVRPYISNTFSIMNLKLMTHPCIG